jgi:hypothetical protein
MQKIIGNEIEQRDLVVVLLSEQDLEPSIE